MDTQTGNTVLVGAIGILGAISGTIVSSIFGFINSRIEKRDLIRQSKIDTYKDCLFLLNRYESRVTEAYKRGTSDKEDLLRRRRKLDIALATISLLPEIGEVREKVRITIESIGPMYEIVLSQDPSSADKSTEWGELHEKYIRNEGDLIESMRSNLGLD